MEDDEQDAARFDERRWAVFLNEERTAVERVIEWSESPRVLMGSRGLMAAQRGPKPIPDRDGYVVWAKDELEAYVEATKLVRGDGRNQFGDTFTIVFGEPELG